MKLDQDNIAGLIVLTFAIIVISILAGSLVWDSQQIRVMYSNAYAKNQECRAEIAKQGTVNALSSVERVCGAVPKFEDYRK